MAEERAPQGARPGVGRRAAILIGAGSAVGGAAIATGAVGIAGAGSGDRDAAADAPAPTVPLRRFRSSMVTMPKVTAHRSAAGTPADGYLMATPVTEVGTAIVVDDDAEPVWIDPEGRYVMDLDVQTYRGEPVLTFWAGKTLLGHGVGAGVILDTAYRPIASVQTGAGVTADMHEFRLTPDGTALVISYPPRPMDLRAAAGPADGWAFDGRVQEIDVATGDVLLDWSALDHVGLSESYQPVATTGTGSGRSADVPWDPVHLNSVEADGDALLVSARHTHTVYRIDRRTGAVRWRMGGRRSDFTVADEARFAWQHDARRHGAGLISLFDNHRNANPGVSAGLLLDVDETAMTVGLRTRYASDGHFGYAEGSMQLLDGGNVLVGWGKDVSATEYTADGLPVLELRNLGADSYRVRRRAWTGRPTTPPDVAAERVDGSLRVFASWNGATEVATWRVRTGSGDGDLTTSASVPRAGFETTVTVPDAAAVRVEALDADGKRLGASRTLTV